MCWVSLNKYKGLQKRCNSLVQRVLEINKDLEAAKREINVLESVMTVLKHDNELLKHDNELLKKRTTVYDKEV